MVRIGNVERFLLANPIYLLDADVEKKKKDLSIGFFMTVKQILKSPPLYYKILHYRLLNGYTIASQCKPILCTLSY